MLTPDTAQQLHNLVPPMQKIIANAVAKQGFHPVTISHAMMIAGMLEMLQAAGKEFTLEIVGDMITALEDGNADENSLQ